jgi:hypothetical protein
VAVAQRRLVVENTSLFETPSLKDKEIGLVGPNEEVVINDYWKGYVKVTTKFGKVGWMLASFIQPEIEDCDNEFGFPDYSPRRFFGNAGNSGTTTIEGPMNISAWIGFTSDLIRQIPYQIDTSNPIRGVETQLVTLQGILISMKVHANGELELKLGDTPSDLTPTTTIFMPPLLISCEARHAITAIIEKDSNETARHIKSYSMKKPVLVGVTGYVSLDDSKLPTLSQSILSQKVLDLRKVIPPGSWRIAPAISLSLLPELLLNEQRPGAAELIRKSLARIDKTAETLANAAIPLAPSTREALDYMKEVFVRPGWVPDRYVDVLAISATTLEALESGDFIMPLTPVVFSQKRTQAEAKAGVQKDVEENLKLMADASKASLGGIVHNVAVSISTVKAIKGGQPIEVPGWEIFYMEYFLRFSRQDVGPNSFKKPSTPSVAELPPGRYLFQAIDPATKQKGEIKASTLLAPDSITLFVQ